MTRARLWPCIAALALLAPTVLAVEPLLAEELQLAGTARLSGDAIAVFALAADPAFSWRLTAPSGVLDRVFSEYLAADHPLNPPHALYQNEPDWRASSETLSDITIASTDVPAGSAFLLLGLGAHVEAVSEGLTLIGSVEDPTLAQDPADARTDGADDGTIREDLSGTFIASTLSNALVTVRGDVVLTLYGPSYALTSAGDTSTRRTGQYETERTALVSRGAMERHTLTLHDALISLSVPGGADLLTALTSIHFEGALRAEHAVGTLFVDGAPLAPQGGALAYEGALDLTLTPGAGGVLASAAGPQLASTGARLAQGPPMPVLGAALGLLALGALAGALWWRRRARPDDLQEALVAMADHRWEDALPRLTRVARRNPNDAGIQVDRALCLEQTGRFQEAARSFEIALRAAPKHAEAHFYYARTLAKMSQREAARAHLEAALEHDPRLVEIARSERVLRGL